MITDEQDDADAELLFGCQYCFPCDPVTIAQRQPSEPGFATDFWASIMPIKPIRIWVPRIASVCHFSSGRASPRNDTPVS